jgi:hypothetical protein
MNEVSFPTRNLCIKQTSNARKCVSVIKNCLTVLAVKQLFIQLYNLFWLWDVTDESWNNELNWTRNVINLYRSSVIILGYFFWNISINFIKVILSSAYSRPISYSSTLFRPDINFTACSTDTFNMDSAVHVLTYSSCCRCLDASLKLWAKHIWLNRSMQVFVIGKMNPIQLCKENQYIFSFL